MSETNEQAYFADQPWTWRERLRFKLLPTRHCPLPEAPATFADCVVCTTFVSLDWTDRLRVLVTGWLKVETRTVTENVVGGCVTSSVAYPVSAPALADPRGAPREANHERD